MLTTPQARIDISKLRGKPAARYVQKVQELRARGCKAGGYRLTGYDSPWICCVHLYAQWRLLARFGDEQSIHILAVGEHRPSHREDIYRRVIALTGIDPPAAVARAKPPCCGKPFGIEHDSAGVDDYFESEGSLGLEPRLSEFLRGDREVEERIRRARR